MRTKQQILTDLENGDRRIRYYITGRKSGSVGLRISAEGESLIQFAHRATGKGDPARGNEDRRTV